MDTQNQKEKNLLKSQGLTYTKKSKRLEDARSSSLLFISFGVIGLILIILLWAGILPINIELYMKILYTVLLGGLFLTFLFIGIYYTKRIKTLKNESTNEEQQTQEIIQYINDTYPQKTLDSIIGAESLPMEQLYFARYDKLSAIIQEKYQIQDEKYLDYLIEQIYQTY